MKWWDEAVVVRLFLDYLGYVVKRTDNLTSNFPLSIHRLCDGYSASDLTALAKDSALGPIRGDKQLCMSSSGVQAMLLGYVNLH